MSYDSWKDNLDHVNNVRWKLYHIVNDLLERGILHDSTKKDVLAKMRPAINHHYQHNSHHPEHYPNGIDGMNLLDLIEMVADWKAAKERHKDKPTSMARSLEINAERFGIDKQLKGILWNTIYYLGWTDESNP